MDDFLDDLFTRLAPLGHAGRRAYLEAEGHLLQSMADARRAGAADNEAALAALERFGPVDDYVRGVGAVTRLSPRAVLARLLANAWLLGGIAACFVGLAGLALSVVRATAGPAPIASDAAGSVYSPQRCAQLATYFPNASSCLDASRLHHAAEIIDSYLALGLLGAVALATFWMARRGRLPLFARLAAAAQPGLVALVGAVGAGVVATLELLQGSTDLALGTSTGVAESLSLGTAAVLAAAALTPRALEVLRS